jgi:phosphate acetyltransferase
MGRKAIFIAATGQNVGKTTICLGLISGLKKKFPRLGFMKPVGQQFVTLADGTIVDKDVILFKEYFHLVESYEHMSPMIVGPGFTKDFLDGKKDISSLRKKITTSFEIISQNDFTIVEGTGHVGVGSLLQLNNADVAALLGLEMILIAQGGIGSSFDELALNRALCEHKGVKIKGVILNRVKAEKREKVIAYMGKALKQWDIPLLGCIPYNQYLNTPSVADFENLFNTRLLSGEEYHYRHFETIRLVATSVETFKEKIPSNQLIVTPATREDIVFALIENASEHGLILTGRYPPASKMIEALKRAKIPSLYAPLSSYNAMKMITGYTAKTTVEDVSKVKKAIGLVESHVNLEEF